MPDEFIPVGYDPFAALGIPPSGSVNVSAPDQFVPPQFDVDQTGSQAAISEPQMPVLDPNRGTVTVQPYRPDLSITERGEVGVAGAGNQANISPDTNGSRSYGILGLNSGSGSALSFARAYPALGLTARPGSAEFDMQWRRAASDQPQALYDAQVDWHGRNVVAPMQEGLLASGVRPEIANDPRVLNYLADRRVQMGTVGWAEAMQLAQGARSPEEYLAAVSANDRSQIATYFHSYLRDHPQDVRGLFNRIALRERLALNPEEQGDADMRAGGLQSGGPGGVEARSVLPRMPQSVYAGVAAGEPIPTGDIEASLSGMPRQDRGNAGGYSRILGDATRAVNRRANVGGAPSDYEDTLAGALPEYRGLAPMIGNMAGNLMSLPQRAFEASETYRQGGPYDARTLLEAAAVPMTGAMPFAERGAVGIFGGRLAKTADLGALKRAEAMEARGHYGDEIFESTGWFRGVDGGWRFEIPDQASKFRTHNAPAAERIRDIFPEGSTQPLGAVLEHPELYAAYPQLPKRPVEMMPAAYSNRGAFAPQTGDFQLNSSMSPEAGRSTMLHEAQHGVQTIEGFAPGADPLTYKALGRAAVTDRDALSWMREVNKQKGRYWNDRELALMQQYNELGVSDMIPKPPIRKYANSMFQHPELATDAEKNVKLFGLDKRTEPFKASEMYMRTAGEVEARNVQARRDFGPKERAELPPFYTQDYFDEGQIVQPPEKGMGWVRSQEPRMTRAAFKKMIDQQKAEVDEMRRQLSDFDKHPRFEMRNGDRSVLASKNIGGTGAPYRITWFDKDGPGGHYEVRDLNELARELRGYGARGYERTSR